MAKTTEQKKAIAKAYGGAKSSTVGVTSGAGFRLTLTPQQKARLDRQRAEIERRAAAS